MTGEANGPTAAFRRLFEPRAIRRPARHFAEQLHGQGSVARRVRSTGRSIRNRSTAGFTDPYFLDKPILFGAQLFRQRLQQLQLYREQPEHDIQAAQHRRQRLSLGFPLNEYWNFGTRYRLSQDNITLDKSTFYTESGDRSACHATRSRQAAICAKKSANADVPCRLFDALRRYRRDPPDARRSSRRSPGFRWTWAATFDYLRTQALMRPNTTASATGSCRFTRRAATSRRSRARPDQYHGPDPDLPIASSTRTFAASTFEASARASFAFRITRTASCRARRQKGLQRGHRRQGLLPRRGSSWSCRSARASRAWPAALRLCRCRVRCGASPSPFLTDIVAFCSPATGRTRHCLHSAAPTADCSKIQRPAIRSDTSNFVHADSGIQGSLPRQFAEAAHFDRHRRQLDFAVRAAAARYRQSARLPEGRRSETLHIQRRNSILMKTLLVSAAFAAAILAPSAASAQAVPAAVVAVVDLDRVTSECNACKTARRGSSKPGRPAFQSREQSLAAPLADRAKVDSDSRRRAEGQGAGRGSPDPRQGLPDQGSSRPQQELAAPAAADPAQPTVHPEADPG